MISQNIHPNQKNNHIKRILSDKIFTSTQKVFIQRCEKTRIMITPDEMFIHSILSLDKINRKKTKNYT